MKNWSGKIQINGVDANVNVVIKSKADWSGSGAVAAGDRDGLMSLYYTGRVAKTAIGSIAISGCKEEDGVCIFAFSGAGDVLAG